MLKFMSPLDKPAGEVTGDVGMGDFGGGSTDGLASMAGELWWFKMRSNRLLHAPDQRENYHLSS